MVFSGFPVASAVDGFGHVANRLQEDAVLILLDFGSALFQSTAVGGTGPVLVTGLMDRKTFMTLRYTTFHSMRISCWNFLCRNV